MERLRGRMSARRSKRGGGRPVIVCTQRGSEYLHKHFVVHTLADEKVLVIGTLVAFLPAEGKDNSGRPLKEAREVTSLNKVFVTPRKDGPRCDICRRPAEMMIEAGYEDSESAEYTRTCLADIDQALAFVLGAGREGRVLKYSDLGLGDKKWRPWTENLEARESDPNVLPCTVCGRKDAMAFISCSVHMDVGLCDNGDCWKQHAAAFAGAGCYPIEL